MAVTLTGSGGLFTRLGKLFGWGEDIRTHQADIATEITDIRGAYTTDPEFIQTINANSFQRAAQIEAGQALLAIRTDAQRTLIEMVEEDTKLPSLSLTEALDELIRQMVSSADSIEQVSPAPAFTFTQDPESTNTGNADFYAALDYGEIDGAIQPSGTARAETINIEFVRDAQVSGTAGRESFSIKGQRAIGDIRDVDWPNGSGIGGSSRLSDPAEDGFRSAGRNVLTNSDFETFTVTNVPDGWTYTTGVAGTDGAEEGSTVYRGSKCFAIIGDGASNNLELSQTIGTQTNGKIKPWSMYFITARMRADSGIIAGGFRIDVVDSTDTIIGNGDAKLEVTGSALPTASWTQPTTTFASHFFSGADIKDGSGLKARITVTAAITNTKKIYIDDLIICEMPQYGGPKGPYIVGVPGDTAAKIGDRHQLAITSNDDTTSKMVWWTDTVFGMHQLGKRFPQSGSPTIADTLVS